MGLAWILLQKTWLYFWRNLTSQLIEHFHVSISITVLSCCRRSCVSCSALCIIGLFWHRTDRNTAVSTHGGALKTACFASTSCQRRAVLSRPPEDMTCSLVRQSMSVTPSSWPYLFSITTANQDPNSFLTPVQGMWFNYHFPMLTVSKKVYENQSVWVSCTNFSEWSHVV